MEQIITVTNQKGGVGKTTLAASLICGLQLKGARVLGIDFDPQGNLAFHLGLDIGTGCTIHDILLGSRTFKESIVHTKYGDVLPADIMLSNAEQDFSGPRREFILAQQLSILQNDYDFIIIDTPPALNILTINAYVASTGIIIPMEAEILSLVGLSQIQDTVDAVRGSNNPNLKVLGIIMNKFNPRLNLSREVLELAEEMAVQMGSHVFPTKIRRGVDVAAAPAHGQSVLTYKPNSKPAMDFQKIIDFVAEDFSPHSQDS